MARDVLEVAKKIIHCTDVERGDTVSNLKLQKLLYYMQGYWLAFFDCPLFDGDIEAWMYGPVSPVAYEYFKNFGSGAIMPEEVDTPDELNFTSDEVGLFDAVMREYGQFSAVKLMEMTHEEAPWKSVPTGKGRIISHKDMRNYFLTQIENA